MKGGTLNDTAVTKGKVRRDRFCVTIYSAGAYTGSREKILVWLGGIGRGNVSLDGFILRMRLWVCFLKIIKASIENERNLIVSKCNGL